MSICAYCGETCPVGYGKCHCGCGQDAPPARRTVTVYGWKKGFPIRFINSHQGKLWPKREDALPFKIDDVYCRLVPLTKGLWAIVDASDYDWLMRWRWCACFQNGSYYAVRADRTAEGKRYILGMHRQIMGLGRGHEIEVDHVNLTPLDNRRDNLRICTHQQNQCNRSLQSNNTTGFKGVINQAGGYAAQIKVNGENIYLGRRKTPQAAHELYLKAAALYHGNFRRLA